MVAHGTHFDHGLANCEICLLFIIMAGRFVNCLLSPEELFAKSKQMGPIANVAFGLSMT